MILVQKSVITIIGLNHQQVCLFIFLFQKSCRKCSSLVDTSGSWVTGCWAITAISAISPCWCADKHHVDVLINIMSTVSPIQIRDACIFMLLSSTHHIFAHLFDIISMSAIKKRFICPKLQSWRRRKVKMVYFPYSSICHLW